MKRLILLLSFMALAACASYDGRGLQPGVSSIDDIQQLMGEAALRWRENDGSERLFFPRGPHGLHTFMVKVDAGGRLTSIENVLEPKHFARLREGMSEEEVIRIIGPPQPDWTVYFESRDELALEWRFCDDYSVASRFNALFDKTSGKLRTTMVRPELRKRPEVCGR